MQFAVTADQLILATQLSTNPADITSFAPMLCAVRHAPAHLGDPDGIGTLLLDAGYASDDTLTAPGPDRLIALGKTRSVRAAARDHPATGPPPQGATPRQAMQHRLRTPEGATLYTRRGATVEPGIGTSKSSSTGSPGKAWQQRSAKSTSQPPPSTRSTGQPRHSHPDPSETRRPQASPPPTQTRQPNRSNRQQAPSERLTPQTAIMKSGSPPVMRGSKQSKGAWRAVTVEAVVAPGPVSAAA